VSPSTPGAAGAPLTITAGTGGVAATSLNSGAGGDLTITAGDAGSNIGNQSWGEVGGDLTLRSGNSTGPYVGGNVAIYSGAGPTAPGAITLNTGTNQWAFDGTGNLTLPNSATIIAPNVNDLTLRVTGQYNICTIQNAGSGYSGSIPLPTTTTGGTGSGMTVNFGYGISGQLVSVSVSDPGTGYSDGDVIGVSGGSGTFVITKYNILANQTNNNTAPTDWIFGNDINLTLPAGGNLIVPGAIVGSSGNVTIAANASSTWTFSTSGNLTLPGNTFAVNYANNTPVDVVTRFESFWTVPTGNSTQSFTVVTSATYYLWVDCNIPNGILVWNATATVTNTNVPVVGAQYAWVYNGGGTPIDFTSIPNQFIGTANAIVRSNTAPSATTNRFDFGINNTSGDNVTVRYGWIQIS
jgi:hypothetical protein